MTEYTVEPFISEKQINSKILDLANQINGYYGNEPIVVLGILKGSFIFLADLVRYLKVPLEIEFISASSYGDGITSGQLEIELDVRKSIEGKRVLIVEDIIDTGHSISSLQEKLLSRNPKSIDIVTLLSKPSRREKHVSITFKGFTIDDKFVVGYGMDYAEKHRELPYVGIICFD